MTLKPRTLATSLRRAMFAAGALSITGMAFAQEAPQASATDRDPVTLDRITVTAQSREQQLQDVPIALQVVSAELLRDVAAEDLGDVAMFVPGLEVDAVQPTQPGFKLRGIQTDDFGIGTDPAVGVFVDGVYGGRGGGVLLPFVDLERIEVLKGPQGTLFGRNTAAGAISLITRRPQPEFEARASLRIGNYGKRYVDGMLNIPTSANSALRINALSNKSDGWFQDGATGKDLAGDNVWATRAAWELRVGDDTTVLLSWDHEDLDQNGRVSTGIVPLPPYPQRPAAPANPASYLDPRKLQTFSDTDVSDEARLFDGVNLIIDHDTAWGTLTSTTSWRQYDSNNWTEEDGTNRPNLYVDSQNTESNETWYQELKLHGFNDRLDWVVGASWFKEDAYQTSEVNTNTDTVDNIVRNLGIAPTPDGSLFGYFTAVAQQFQIPVTLLGHHWNERFLNTANTTAYAAFGDVIWHVSDKTNLTLGLRYTRDEKKFSWLNNPRSAPGLDAALNTLEAVGFFAALAQMQIPITKQSFIFDMAFIDPPAIANKGITNRARKSWSDWSPRVVLDHHFSDTGMVFASVAKGYKAGGFNALQIGPVFDNENVWNFETGIKQSFGDFAYNASLYRYNYDNRQGVRLIDPDPDNPTDIPRFVVDTGDLEAWGLEADMQWQVSKAFSLNAAAAWIDSKYTSYVTPERVDLDGQPTGEPRFSASLGAIYDADLDGNGRLRFSARHAYRGSRRCNDGDALQGSCGISPVLDIGESQQRTDVRVSWSSPQDRWTVAAYGNNVFDHRYVTGTNTYGAAVLGVVGAGVTPPRTYGLEVSLKY
ncbi:MAG: TonB-dependent receptor [Lysobacteraceae bacterium]|nr:MAG: TonB-dependent receptor [Xanthomonadaceae bacterium]